MDRVITIMEEKDMPDYQSAVDKFFGDFYATYFFSPHNDVEKVSQMYKIGDVVAVEYKSGEAVYQSVHDGKLYTINRASPDAKPILSSVEEYPYTEPMSIFSVFGFDMSRICSSTDDEEPDIEQPKLTYEDLFITEDRKQVEFSKAYLAEIAKYLLQGIEMEKHQVDSFLGNMTVSGAYMVFEQIVSFKFEGHVEELGDVTFEIETDFRGMEFNGMTTTATISSETDGVKLTTSQIHTIDDLYLKDGEITSVFISDKLVITSEYTQDNVPYVHTSEDTLSARFKFDESWPIDFDVMQTVRETITSPTEKQKGEARITFNFYNESIHYDASSNSTSLANIDFSKFKFYISDDVCVPKDVLDLLPNKGSEIL